MKSCESRIIIVQRKNQAAKQVMGKLYSLMGIWEVTETDCVGAVTEIYLK